MTLNQKIGVYLLTSALALNCCTSNSQIKKLENKVQNLEQKISRITATNQIRDVDELYQKMIEPTVRVELANRRGINIGAGTILYSKKEDNGLFYSYILTSEHIIETTAQEFSIRIFKYLSSENSLKFYPAEAIALDGITDLALLEVISEEELPVASLIPKDRISELKTFERVYAVGCPVEGNPVQSYGEISNPSQAGNFWRISAPTKPGNSGGGIYLESTKELIGVFHAIEAEEVKHKHRNERSSTLKNHEIIFPHLGIITSPIAIYDFLEEQNLQFIYDNNFTREECFEGRER